MNIWNKTKLSHTAIKISFLGVPDGDEYYYSDFYKMAKLLEKNPSYSSYVRSAPFSDDGMAYATPWYANDIVDDEDKDKDFQNSYRSFVWSLYKIYGIKVAEVFFTKNFKKHIKPNMLLAIENIFFKSKYVDKWT